MVADLRGFVLVVGVTCLVGWCNTCFAYFLWFLSFVLGWVVLFVFG